MSLQKIAEMKQQYEATMRAEGKQALAEEFKAFFAAHPEITAVRWRQYTPYFNDGDPCVFRLCSIYFRSPGWDEDGGDYSDGFCDEYDGAFKALPEATRDACRALSEALNANEDVLEAVLGDHVRVTATAEGFDVEEHAHD